MKFIINIQTNEIYLTVSEAKSSTGTTAHILRNISNPDESLLIEPESKLKNEEVYLSVTAEKIVSLVKQLK